MKRLLLHVCCAHCAAYTLNYWQEEGREVTAWWYNPNIHPYQEHESRLEAVRSLAEKTGVPLIIASGYDMVSYFRLVAGHEAEGERCQYCFRLRLGKAAQASRQGGFDSYSSTLLISPHQRHDLIVEVANKIADETGTCFDYADLRKRYSDSRHITKPMALYRQQYCGCIYSEWERFAVE